MNLWVVFWAVALVVAGASFVIITGVVTVKGFRDLRQMFRGLAEQAERER